MDTQAFFCFTTGELLNEVSAQANGFVSVLRTPGDPNFDKFRYDKGLPGTLGLTRVARDELEDRILLGWAEDDGEADEADDSAVQESHCHGALGPHLTAVVHELTERCPLALIAIQCPQGGIVTRWSGSWTTLLGQLRVLELGLLNGQLPIPTGEPIDFSDMDGGP